MWLTIIHGGSITLRYTNMVAALSSGATGGAPTVANTAMGASTRDTHPKTITGRGIWGVTTTIFAPTPSTRTFLNVLEHARLCSVGDKKTDDSVWRRFQKEVGGSRVVYLSASDQEALSTSGQFEAVQLLPWNHFGRKNLGYLYAIRAGAEWIFDYDDDNILNTPVAHSMLATVLRSHTMPSVKTNYPLYNPYPDFKPTLRGKPAFVWPRGFPLDYIRSNMTFDKEFTGQTPIEQVHVFQSLADHDPDVDAIYRMTQGLPLYFSERSKMAAVPKGTYACYLLMLSPTHCA